MNPYVNLEVKAQDGTLVHFKIGKTTKLGKLMEAYFAPAAVHKRETRSLLGLLKVALQRHAEVFTGSSTFCARGLMCGFRDENTSACSARLTTYRPTTTDTSTGRDPSPAQARATP